MSKQYSHSFAETKKTILIYVPKITLTIRWNKYKDLENKPNKQK